MSTDACCRVSSKRSRSWTATPQRASGDEGHTVSMARHKSVISHASEVESASDTLRCESAANEVTETVDDADDDAADEEAEANDADADEEEASAGRKEKAALEEDDDDDDEDVDDGFMAIGDGANR